MDIDAFNQYCRSLKGTTYVEQWGNSQVWKVGAKVFAIGSTDKQGKLGFTFKTSEINFYFLNEKPGYRPAPYLASRGMLWIQQFDALSLEEDLDEELCYYLSASYKLVASKLSKKKQKALGLEEIAM